MLRKDYIDKLLNVKVNDNHIIKMFYNICYHPIKIY